MARANSTFSGQSPPISAAGAPSGQIKLQIIAPLLRQTSVQPGGLWQPRREGKHIGLGQKETGRIPLTIAFGQIRREGVQLCKGRFILRAVGRQQGHMEF
jgi:hypothetical protein